jgi:ubiquinone/menaquinone biosynthesis C-methylase UbiE
MTNTRTKRDFDKDAVAWDQNPSRVALARDIAAAIKREIRLASDMDVLDFGCGTGLLTLELLPAIRSVTAVDSSQGMLNVFKEKIAKSRIVNIRLRHVDIDKGGALTGHYHMAVSTMTLHHIKEIRPLFRQFYDVVIPGGYLCIADLDCEGGAFHADNAGVFHHGFNREAMRKDFIEAGFSDVRDVTAAKIIKPVAGGSMREFNVFLTIGRKK